MATKSAVERIADIRAKADAEIAAIARKREDEISAIQAEAKAELEEKRKAALQVLRGVEDAITELTGKAPKAGRGKGGAGKASLPDVPNEKILKDILKGAEGKRLNRKGINAAGYNLKSALMIAKGEGATFGAKQNKAQGEVWLK